MSSKKTNKNIGLKKDVIGERLRQFAKDKFRTIRALAEALNMSEENLSQYIKGKSAPGAPLLIKLAEKGCDIQWLLTGVEIDFTEKGFNNYINITRAFLRLKELEEEYPKALNEIKELKKEREQILKLLNNGR